MLTHTCTFYNLLKLPPKTLSKIMGNSVVQEMGFDSELDSVLCASNAYFANK